MIVLVGFAQAAAPSGQAQTPARFDPRTVVLPQEELPGGLVLDPSQTVYEERADGSVVHEALYARERSEDNPTSATLKLAVGRFVSSQVAGEQYGSIRQAFLQAGWKERPVPLLGDEAFGLSQEGTGAESAHIYLFRNRRHLAGATVTGSAQWASMDQAIGLAVRLSARLDATLATLPADPPEAAGAPITPSTVSGPAQSGSSRPVAEGARMRPSERPATEPAMLLEAKLEDPPDVGEGLTLGGFSGLFALDNEGKTFATLTDRGPNGEIQVRGKKQMSFPLPSYTPRIVKLRLESGKLRIAETVQLRLIDGYTDLVTNSRDVTGLPNMEEAGETPYEMARRDRLPFDPYGVDTEGIALDPRDGTFWLAEEYGPSIMHVGADGTILLRLVPRGLDLVAPGQNIRPLLPEALVNRKPNRGFEGIAISPDGSRLFAIMQSPLSLPDKKAGESSRHIRLVALDTTDSNDPKMVGTYVYRAESARDVGAKEQDDVKVGDLAALTNTKLLVGERDSFEGGAHKKLYAIDIDGATNVAERADFGGKSLEQASESDLRKQGVQYVGKSLIVDLAKLGYRPDKLEGIAIVDQNTIAVINDNDFGIESIDDRNQLVRSNAPSRFALIRVPDLPR